MTNRLLLLQLLLVSLIGCGGSGDSGGACSPLNAKVFGGDACDQEARTPVVFLVAIGTTGEELFGLSICTASLITLDDLLTSAHCFTDTATLARQRGVTIAGYAAKVGGDRGEIIPLSNARLHPFYNGQAGSPFDVAMATLSKVPSPPIGPLPLLLSEVTVPGSAITAFGYGTNQSGGVGELRASNFRVSSIIDGNLIVVGDGKSSICGGDSGGPAVYVTSQGVATLAGVNSFGLGACLPNASRLFGFVDIQTPLILDFIAAYAPDAAVF